MNAQTVFLNCGHYVHHYCVPSTFLQVAAEFYLRPRPKNSCWKRVSPFKIILSLRIVLPNGTDLGASFLTRAITTSLEALAQCTLANLAQAVTDNPYNLYPLNGLSFSGRVQPQFLAKSSKPLLTFFRNNRLTILRSSQGYCSGPVNFSASGVRKLPLCANNWGQS